MLPKKEKQIINSLSSFEPRKNYTSEFARFDIAVYEKMLREKGEDFWREAGEKKALKLFHTMAERVPAYKDFLKKNNVKHEAVRTIADFQNVPITDKKNYIEKYPLAQRAWDGDLSTSRIIAASSGTTGEPKFWPRGSFQELEAAVTHELLYKYLFEVDKHKTLLLIGFPMGVYVSGVATVLPSMAVAEKLQNMTVATVGTNKIEILRLLRELSPTYEQTILVGHPFFIKNVIETARVEKIKIPKVKMLFCSEGFNEKWRDYVAGKAKCAPEHALSVYGSSELLLMGMETKESIIARRAFEKRKECNTGLFQYNPLLRFIEEMNGNFVFTVASGIPLVRFDMHDAGKVLSFEEIKKKSAGVETHSGWKIPFVELAGRSDNTFILYAANIYPEHIHTALNHAPFLEKITGKFVMTKGFDKNKDAIFEIHIELQKNNTDSGSGLEGEIAERIFETLKKINLEYADTLKHSGQKRVYPHVRLEQYQDETYFKLGTKPKYILK